jgi:16S rRNA (guanine527-N7)-methyltransferase
MLMRPTSGWPFAEVAAELGVETGDAAALGQWLDLLATWNAKMDLTAAKDPPSLVWLMCADAWLLARALEPGVSLVDVGTGAGAPGLAVAILRRDVRVTLIEPLRKRASFLRTVLGTLGRTDVTLLSDTLENAKPKLPAQGAAVSRATFPPDEWLAQGTTLVRPGGSVWVLLAREPDPDHPRSHVAETIRYEDAHGAAKRLVRYAVVTSQDP